MRLFHILLAGALAGCGSDDDVGPPRQGSHWRASLTLLDREDAKRAKARARRSFAPSRRARRDRTVAGVPREDMLLLAQGRRENESFPGALLFFAAFASSRLNRPPARTAVDSLASLASLVSFAVHRKPAAL
jgi:hypothetical protein